MKLDKKGLFSLLLGVSLLTNVLELLHVNVLYTTTLLSFCVYLLLPGLLISLILRIRNVSLWENLALIVGFGIAFLEFGGLLLNILLPLVRINNPLAFQNLLAGFDAYLSLLFIIAWVRTKRFNMTIRLSRRSNIEKVLYTLPPFFPVLAALGAIMLNNGGSNVLTLVLLGTIGCYALLLVFFREKISTDLYPYALFFIGLACLFTTSLRSWYISGHDITREFYVFQLTNVRHIWNIAAFPDPYNACLSITILPTILANLLFIPDAYVYKVIFQVLFAVSPVLVFILARKYTASILAFFSAFLFLSFPLFFTDMPMLNRQEIAFLFFGLVLYMMFPSELPLMMRKVLFSVFAISVAVSHYSTFYIVLPLLMFVYIFAHLAPLSFAKNMLAFLRRKTRVRPHMRLKTPAFLTFPILLLLLGLSFFWFASYTKSLNNVGAVISQVFSSTPLKSSDLSYYLFSPQMNPDQQLQEHIQTLINSEKANAGQFYSSGVTSQYSTHAIAQEVVAPTPLGDVFGALHIPLYKNQEDISSLPAVLLQILILISCLALFSFKDLRGKIRDKIKLRKSSSQVKEELAQQSLDKQVNLVLHGSGSWPLAFSGYTKSFDRQFLLLYSGTILLLALMFVLPAISALFGLLRMFQQFLFLLSLPAVVLVYHVLFFMKERKRILAMGFIFVLLFLNFTGFIPHLTGNYYAQINLDNSGLYYDTYYTHESDVLAVAWLSHTDLNGDPVEADASGVNKLLPYENIFASDEIFPPLIQRAAYVLVKDSVYVIVNVDNRLTIINSPKPFLDTNKNRIYSNGDIEIYK